jgi:1-acyl-sn-glycerol-3-phosphate acyltransferase
VIVGRGSKAATAGIAAGDSRSRKSLRQGLKRKSFFAARPQKRLQRKARLVVFLYPLRGYKNTARPCILGFWRFAVWSRFCRAKSLLAAAWRQKGAQNLLLRLHIQLPTAHFLFVHKAAVFYYNQGEMIKTIALFGYLGLYLVLHSVVLPFWLLFFFLGMRGARRGLMRVCGRLWARHFLFLLGARVLVEGAGNMPADDRVCLICNHQSQLDVLVIMAWSGKTPGFVAKKELVYVPMLNLWMLLLHCVFIERRNIRKSFLAIERGAEAIRRGNPMVIFPEGTRSRTGKIGEFKPGSLKLATRSEALIVPVTLVGTAGLFEKTGRLRADTVRMVIHRPIPTEGLSKEEEPALAGRVRRAIASALPEDPEAPGDSADAGGSGGSEYPAALRANNLERAADLRGREDVCG